MKLVIVGGVAAGTKTAAKLMRQQPGAQVTIYTRSQEISYAGCGLPYYVGGHIEGRDELIVNTPARFTGLTGAAVRTGMEAVSLNASAKTVTFASGESVDYDKLVIATGAEPVIPPVEGTALPGVFALRTPDDAIGLRAYMEEQHCRSAVVVGGGLIGLEVAENLLSRSMQVTVVEKAPQLLPQLFDAELADHIRRQLQAKGMRIVTGAALEAVLGSDKATGVSTGAGSFEGDVVVLAMGVRPATAWLEGSGIEMNRGAIVTDNHMQTNLPDVYAVGDCAQVFNRLTLQPQWSAMGSTANITGRLLARHLSGETVAYGGCLGTGIARLAKDLNAGRTGLTEAQALAAGYDVMTATCVVDDKPHYYEGASSFVIKLIADKASHKLLGMQALGAGEVDKLVDMAVVGLSLGATPETYDTLDLAYAPPFSTAIHPFVQACYVLENKLSGAYASMTPAQYAAGMAKGYKVVDVSPAPAIPGAVWVDLTKLSGPVDGLGLQDKLLLVCARGRRAYLLQNRLRALGYTNTLALEGGLFLSRVQVAFEEGAKLPPAEIKRVKGLGCLQDKRYNDVFNVRVITRNGYITADEHRTIAEAAESFGSGAVTMTTRLTLEIQGVKHANIQPLIDFLNAHGLSTGGTGSLVRPVVSCKGTTCQYGLADTFDLSEKLHERFYVGYHDVTLPHKFKICVGGCPNNCAKPSLNDLGIVGQKMPMIDYARCRGCKKCQVAESCPIKVAHVEDGKVRVDPGACNNCGRCAGKCPFGAMEEYQRGFKVYIGGRWGKKIAHGQPLTRLFTSEEEVMDVVEKAILLFRDEGIPGERFADTIDRLGFDYVNDKLISGELDKSAILSKTVKGGATC